MVGMKSTVTNLPKPPTDDEDEGHAPLKTGDKKQTIYMPARVHGQLRELAFHEGRSQQELIREAMNMLFANRGCPSWEELKK